MIIFWSSQLKDLSANYTSLFDHCTNFTLIALFSSALTHTFFHSILILFLSFRRKLLSYFSSMHHKIISNPIPFFWVKYSHQLLISNLSYIYPVLLRDRLFLHFFRWWSGRLSEANNDDSWINEPVSSCKNVFMFRFRLFHSILNKFYNKFVVHVG